MAAIPLVLRTEPYYKAFREKHVCWGVAHRPVVAERFVWVKADVQSRHAQLLLPEDQCEPDNVAFALPLVLPRQGWPFRRVIIILHGLNESEYRKYFPWACTLASIGWPVLLFPITFLVNRRPRQWRKDVETQRGMRARLALPGNGVVTHYNAILSERLDRHPERLLLGGRQSYFDVLDVATSLHNGAIAVDNGGDAALIPRQPFAAGTHVDFLGFSIGGYLTLGLLLGEDECAVLASSRAIIFAAAAPFVHADQALNANPLSPFILDARATQRLCAFYGSSAAEPFLDNPQGQWWRAMFRAEGAVLDRPLRRIRDRILAVGNTADTVVPTEGMAATLGRLDCTLALGAHEYPFNLADVWQAGSTRSIAKSYNIHPRYEEGFRQFMQAVVDFLP